MDAELAKQIANGESNAAPLLVSYVGPKLAGYADRIAEDLTPADRDEIVQLALERVAKRIQLYDPEKGSLATWARPYVLHTAQTWRRDHPGGAPTSLDTLPDLPDLADPASDEPNPGTERRAAAVSSLLSNLTSSDQHIIQLRLTERLTFPAIAKILLADADASPERLMRFETACRKRFTRAVAKLRKLAADHPDLQDLT
jgi:RNA polymerase sigma factor (sigma-70 family)